ncbi:MAG: adenylate/guanylate cyclase domain-containing protein [Nitrosomonadales bacterium]|nr:adenylate/guanylate cyclase domain-containing protein [Nitrosomonadales bacterium]
MEDQPNKLAILFADVAGSTKMYETLGDSSALANITRCLGLLEDLTKSGGGRLIKTIGDEVMVAFPDAQSAMQAAIEMQLGVDNMPRIDTVKMAVRMGFHYGEAQEVDGDVFGDTVNVAARMTGLAKGGQIITTEQTVISLPQEMRAQTRFLDALTVKGKADDVRIYEVIWQESSEMTMMTGRLAPPPPVANRIRLIHAGENIVLDADNPAVTLGRDATADITIPDKMASRMHAKIERRRDKFVLVDQSTNGTYVTIAGEKEMMLRREEMILRGSGTISLGHPMNASGEYLEFFSEL